MCSPFSSRLTTWRNASSNLLSKLRAVVGEPSHLRSHNTNNGGSKSSTGANSLAIRRSKGKTDLWIAVGGDFTADSLRDRNCFLSKDAGKSWGSPRISPTGYRSCVEFISDTKLITCGLNGVDLSEDEGNTWKKISSDSFHACRKAKKGDAVFFSGNNGRIGKLSNAIH